MDTLICRPFMVAFLAGLLVMAPQNIFKVCAWNAGTMKVDPWRIRASAAVQKVSQTLRTWLSALWSPGIAYACAGVLLALMAMHFSASHEGVLAAALPLATLKATRATALREAESFRSADGTFADDQKRASFDAKMTEVDGFDAQIRTAEEAERTQPNPGTPAPNVEQVRAAEQTRITGIQDVVKRAKLDPSVAADMVSRNITVDAARSEAFEKMAERSQQNPTNGRIETGGEDARDKFVRGAANWLFVRSGMAALVAKRDGVTVDKIDPGEFRGMSLLDLARESLTRAGVTVRGMDKMSIAGQAMAHRSNYQTTSDFATLLENAMHKVLRAAYATQSDTWSRFCGIGSVSDFRAHNWYRMGALGSYDSINEHGEFKNKTIPDAEKTTYTATTKGNIVGITREVVVNDDIAAVMRFMDMLGRAGKLTIEKAVYALLGQNSGLGPTMGDSVILFHTTHANINATAAAITVASMEADRAVMRSQMDPNSQEYLDLLPTVLLVPVGKRGEAITINDAQFDPADNKFQKPNTVRGLFKDVIDTPRLSGTRRYLFADPSVAPVFLVSFLEGMQEPVLETQDGWRFNGVEMKARLDFGVDCVDYRGAVTNAGA